MQVFTTLPMNDWSEAGPAAQAAEVAGFDALMTLEAKHDAFMPLAVAALATRRIALTTSIAVAFPRSPTVTAMQAWDLHANSKGRFVLGLGSQVKGHNERRFGIPWSPPAPRLREYVHALRAIWRCWQTGETLGYEGEYYRLTLMTPDFSPEPTGLPMVPVTIAAVGPAMLRVAGEEWRSDVSCDPEPPMGSLLHLTEVPPDGGSDTMLANMFRAYEALSEPIRKLITGMKAVHNGKHAYERRGYREGAEYPQAEHPIVRTPPVAGRQALFVNRIFTTRIVGLSKSKSVAILEMLYRHIETFDVQGAGGDIQSAGRQCGWV